jgi:archaellum component FlaG (FlaF/FlaG flagellin family)
MKRRTLLASGVALASAIAGCSGIGGEETSRSTPEEQSLDTTASDGTATESATDTTDTNTETATESEGTDTATPTETAAETQIDYDVELTEITKCGTTCRTATFTVKNTGQKDAPSTSIDAEVLTGGDSVFDDAFEIGDVSARSQRKDIQRDIDVGLGGAQKIQGNDGEVIIEMTPESGDYTGETFSFDRTLDV